MRVADVYSNPLPDKYLARFWSYVNKTDSCWEWAKSTVRGYGSFGAGGVTVYCHKLSWCLHHGPVPDGLCVLHRCDNRKCVNPEHLFLGTREDNIRDMIAKDRSINLSGSSHGMSKLTEDQVRYIKTKLLSQQSLSSLSREFGVSVQTIYAIHHGKTWKHVTL